MANKPTYSPNSYQRTDQTIVQSSEIGSHPYHRYASAEVARIRRKKQTPEQRENAVIWMLLYSTIEHYSEQERTPDSTPKPVNGHYIGFHGGRATLSTYTLQIESLDLDLLCKKYPLRFAMAELVVKLGLFKHTNFIGGIVARLEKYPSWRDALSDEYILFRKKKGTGWRVIYCPSVELKALQRSIHRNLSDQFHPHESCHGFISGKSNISNASLHTGKHAVLRIDIKKAFESASRNAVISAIKSVFSSLDLSDRTLYLLSAIVTYRNHLPTGAPTSPLLLNAILHNFDANVYSICESLDLTYSRYADDLIISGNAPDRILEIVLKELGELGFKANNKKTRQMNYWQRQTVTGVVVNHKTNLDGKMRKTLRAAVYSWICNGSAHLENDEVNLQMLKGHLSYAIGVNKDWGHNLLRQLNRGTED